MTQLTLLRKWCIDFPQCNGAVTTFKDQLGLIRNQFSVHERLVGSLMRHVSCLPCIFSTSFIIGGPEPPRIFNHPLCPLLYL